MTHTKNVLSQSHPRMTDRVKCHLEIGKKGHGRFPELQAQIGKQEGKGHSSSLSSGDRAKNWQKAGCLVFPCETDP